MAHLQSWDAFADWLRILSQQALFIKELAVPPIAWRLEKPVVQDVFQALVEGAQDPLLGDPHCRIGVEAHAFLVAEPREKQMKTDEKATTLTRCDQQLDPDQTLIDSWNEAVKHSARIIVTLLASSVVTSAAPPSRGPY